MGTEIRCCECGSLVSEDEMESGSDGRSMCCCCRLQEADAKLAENDRDERTADTASDRAGIATEVSAATRSSAPPEPAHADWAGLY
jgi:hypothetical protein